MVTIEKIGTGRCALTGKRPKGCIASSWTGASRASSLEKLPAVAPDEEQPEIVGEGVRMASGHGCPFFSTGEPCKRSWNDWNELKRRLRV